MKRRNFLKNSSFAALGSVPVANTLLNLKLMSNAMAQGSGEDDYKALVCVFLAGGNDAYNMLVPIEQSEYDNYADVRDNLALPFPGSGGEDALLPLKIQSGGGREFGLHGAMTKLQGRVDDGNATFVANLGSLLAKPDIDTIRAGINLPRALFSHSDQQKTWQTSVADTTSKTGWGGRLADKIIDSYSSSQVSMNISLAGNKKFLVGDQAVSYAIGQNGATLLKGAGSNNAGSIARVKGAKNIALHSHEHLLLNAFAQEKNASFDAADIFSNAFNSQDVLTPFGNSSLDQDLKAVATTIASANQLGQQRQIFFVQLGGFDHHADLLNNQRGRLTLLDNALDSFWNFIDGQGQGLRDKVTTFTCSDFGRSLRTNGSGSDHAWAGHSIVMGGAVKQRLENDGVVEGSKIYGHYPTADELKVGSNKGLDVGSNGRLMPTTSIDEYFAELALWFGLSKSELEDVLPNIREFYDPTSSENPLGFLPAMNG